MSNIPTVALDLDGTILDTSNRHYAVYRLVAQSARMQPLKFSDYWKQRRNGYNNIEVLFQNSSKNFCYESAKSIWLEHIESIEMLKMDRIFPGVLEWLQERMKKVIFFLLTLRSNPLTFKSQIKNLGLACYFEGIEVIPHQQNAATAKAECIPDSARKNLLAWIGDTEVDIEAARKLGVLPIGVTSGIRTSYALRSAGAAKIYNYITDIEMWR